ncbi:hypothetical protein [Alicyclobacillus macrosporangiidus]|jgi:hypothetical protein|uniref:DUF3168 domain-containing protein n=1 Tax=Alicyclobacillus macrosporangiidus TaxID=392015 RepID=A0A1I7FW76_9BACL|nr:hypothetical protein [Alicyclobacillus macrosporangiidus]SFU40403.1 hypothetical protein SAMN05421543_101481 [Alicyclobacillus macrosporangiidus]
MSLRRAVILTLKQVPGLAAVYQAYLAPSNAPRPYATVKIVPGVGSSRIWYAGTQEIEVRLYGNQTSFHALDTLERSVIAALHGRTITDTMDNPPTKYETELVPQAGMDFVEPENELIGRLVIFRAASLIERGTE